MEINVIYVKPIKDLDILYEIGNLLWFPYVRIKYTATQERDILFSCFTSSISSNPQSTILLARKTSMFKIVNGKIHHGKIVEIPVDPNEILEDIVNVYDMVIVGMQKHFDEFREDIDINIDWNRFRAIFTPTLRLIERRRPVFKYLWGQYSSPLYSVLNFVRFIIEEGLGYRKSERIRVHSTEKIYYPILVGLENEFYEIGWNLEKSLTLEWLFQVSDQFKKIILENIRGKENE